MAKAESVSEPDPMKIIADGVPTPVGTAVAVAVVVGVGTGVGTTVAVLVGIEVLVLVGVGDALCPGISRIAWPVIAALPDTLAVAG
jgi:hypothetical protein